MSAPTHVRTAPVVGKVTIYAVDTGAALERWPVDARALIVSGTYTWAAPGAPADAPAPDWARGLPGAAPVPVLLLGAVPLTPLGEPVRATRAHEATAATSFVPPAGYTGKGKDRDRSGRR